MLKRRSDFKFKYASGSAEVVGDRQIRVVASDPTPDRVGDILEPRGCDVSSYRKNPVVLANHDPGSPIGTASVVITDAAVLATITFAPPGTSVKSDEFCALAKAGVISAVSVGFMPKDCQPLKSGGVRVRAWELAEISLVAVPCNPSALVVERALRSVQHKSGRVLSQANSDHLDAVMDALGEISDLHDATEKNIGTAARHALAIRANAAGVAAEDNEYGEAPDNELAARAARRKQVELLRQCEPQVSADEQERARRYRLIEVLEVRHYDSPERDGGRRPRFEGFARQLVRPASST